MKESAVATGKIEGNTAASKKVSMGQVPKTVTPTGGRYRGVRYIHWT